MKSKPNIFEIAFAGLLHDIGKIMQRAEEPLSQESNFLEHDLCKNGGYKYTMWTNDLFQKLIIPKNIDRIKIAHLASRHHNPSNFYEEIIQIADWCSSGMNISPDEKNKTNTDCDKFKKTPILSPFSTLFGKTEKIYLPLKPLEVNSKTLLPKKEDEYQSKSEESFVEDYKVLFREFLNNINNYDIKNENIWLDAIASALLKSTWCVPTSIIDMPDISLYDHSVTTAGIAVALFKFAEEKNINNKEELQRTKPFRLISGDLSGIQNYIYNLSSDAKGEVHKILRARSFSLSAYTESAAIGIIERLGLTNFNILLQAGGKFTIIVANTDQTLKHIKEIRKELSDWFYKKFHGELNLNLAFDTECSIEDLKAGTSFDKVLGQLGRNINKTKLKKLRHSLQEKGKWQPNKFKIDKNYNARGVCSTCKVLPKQTENGHCFNCNEMAKLGSFLVYANYIEYSKEQENYFEGPLNINFRIHKNKNFKIDNSLLVYAVNKTDDKFGSRFLANYIPHNIDNKTPWDFKKIARTQPDNNHAWFLGYLRIDIDNLGKLFRKGIKNISISKYASVSKMFDLFFSGWLNKKVSTSRNDIYTVYAGGDDLFLIGPWNSTIEFAYELAKTFSEFTGERCHLSAGLAFAKPRFPINRAAKLSGDNLEKAKLEGRNSFNLFGRSIMWEDFPKVQKLQNTFCNIINNNENINQSFLFQLLEYHRMYLSMKTGNTEDAIFLSRMAYNFKRNKISENPDLNNIFIEAQNQTTLMDNLDVPIRWALYKTRG